MSIENKSNSGNKIKNHAENNVSLFFLKDFFQFVVVFIRFQITERNIILRPQNRIFNFGFSFYFFVIIS